MSETNSGYDAIVIGSGSVGTPSSVFLAQKGFKVLVLDGNASAGQGENKAAIGGVRATHSDPAKIKVCQESLGIFSTWQDRYDVDVGWKKGGYTFPVYEQREEDILKSILPIQKEYELNIDWKDPDYIKQIVPGINPNGLRGGTFSPDDGQVSPLMSSEAFTKEGRNLGVDFHFREDVTDILVQGDRVTGVKTNKGEYMADVILNAAGAKATAVCEMADFSIPVMPDSHEAGISAPVKDFLGPLVVDLRPSKDGKTSNFYFGQNHEGALIFCYTPSPLFPGVDHSCTSEFMPIIAKRLVSLIPRLKNLVIRRLWRGLYPMTPDGVAVVGKWDELDGMYLGIGMCGQGFMMGPGVANNLASLISSGKPVMDSAVFDTLSPKRDFYAQKTELLK